MVFFGFPAIRGHIPKVPMRHPASAPTRRRTLAAALAIAAAYRLSPAETRAWLELLFGAPTLPIADNTPWGDSLERVYELLERARAPPPHTHIYITISSRSCQRC